MVLDAGLATEENIAWLVDQRYRYLVVSRRRHREFDAEQAVAVKDEGDWCIQVQREVNANTGEVALYCHSSEREKKDQSIQALFSERFEAELEQLAASLHQKGTVKRYDKVLERVGRLKQRYARAAQYYDVTVEHDEVRGQATALHWARNKTRRVDARARSRRSCSRCCSSRAPASTSMRTTSHVAISAASRSSTR
jgi:hypothetical protein